MRVRSPWWLLAIVVSVLVVACTERIALSVSVSPSEVTLAPGESQVFTATVHGSPHKGVTWSSSAGHLASSGLTASFLAPEEAGQYVVTATSDADATKSAAASVIVRSSSGGITVPVDAGGGVVGEAGGPQVVVPPGAIHGAERVVSIEMAQDQAAWLAERPALVGQVVSVRVDEAFGVDTDAASGLLVALPLGTHADRIDELAIAVKIPAAAVVGLDVPTWIELPGVVSEDGESLVVDFYALFEEDVSFGLIHAPELARLRTATAPVSAVPGVSPAGLFWRSEVMVQYPSGSLAHTLWTQAERDTYAAFLKEYAEEAIAGFRALGFKAPDWRTNLLWSKYVINLWHPDDLECRNAAGFYEVGAMTMHVCWNMGGSFGQPDGPNTTRFVTRHEIFHAVQNAYFWLPGSEYVFSEAPATLAMRSLDGAVRRTPDLPPEASMSHRASVLSSDLDAMYRAQDLFAFLLRANGLGFEAMADLLDTGTVSWEWIGSVLQRNPRFAAFASFEDFYWAYVRNQRFERSTALGDASEPIFGVEGRSPLSEGRRFDGEDTPCTATATSRAISPPAIAWSEADASYGFRFFDGFVKRDGYEQSFSAISVRFFEFTGGDLVDGREVGAEARLRYTVDGVDGSLVEDVRAVFYPAGSDCQVDGIEATSLDGVIEALERGPLYVLVANLSPERGHDLEFMLDTLSSTPGTVDVTVEPSNVTLPVNGTQSFTATVAGGSDASVSWSTTCGRVGGVGNSVTYTAPSDVGTCTVTATSVADPSASASAAVVVTAAPADDLVGYWSFDDCSARDDSGNGYDGVVQGVSRCVAGVSGQALLVNSRSDASVQCVELPPISGLSGHRNWELTFWFRREGVTTVDGTAVLSFGEANTGGELFFAVWMNDLGEVRLQFEDANFGSVNGGGGTSSVSAWAALQDGVFHEIRAVRGGATASLYVDDVLIDTIPVTADLGLLGSADGYLGAHAWWGSGSSCELGRLTGYVDELRIEVVQQP